MRAIDIWNKRTLLGIRVTLCVVLLLLMNGVPRAQAQVTIHQPFYDYAQNVHFGFTIGTNFSRFQYRLSEDFYNNDSLLNVRNNSFPGLTLAAVSNWHVTERLDIRFLPTLVLNQRRLDFYFDDGRVESKEIESVLLELPVTAKYKATRHNNFRFYILGGGKYSYDIASQADAAFDPVDPIIAVKPHQYSFEFGFGFDIYFAFFKFSPEIKISHGINNVLVEDPNIFSSSFNGLYTRFLYFNMHFEG